MVYKGAWTDYDSSDCKAGYTYCYDTEDAPTGLTVEVGDMLIAKVDNPGLDDTANWTVVQSNITGAVTYVGNAVTDGGIVVFDGTTGKLIKGSTLNGLMKLVNGVPAVASASVADTLDDHNPQIWLFTKTRIRNTTNKSFKISHPVHYLADGGRYGVEYSTGAVETQLLDYNTGAAVSFLYRHTEEGLVKADYAWHRFSFCFADFFKTIYKADGLARMVNQNANLPISNYQRPMLINRGKSSPMSQGVFYLAVAIENPAADSWKKWLIGEYSVPFYARYEYYDKTYWRPVLSQYRQNIWIK